MRNTKARKIRRITNSNGELTLYMRQMNEMQKNKKLKEEHTHISCCSKYIYHFLSSGVWRQLSVNEHLALLLNIVLTRMLKREVGRRICSFIAISTYNFSLKNKKICANNYNHFPHPSIYSYLSICMYVNINLWNVCTSFLSHTKILKNRSLSGRAVPSLNSVWWDYYCVYKI